MSRELLKPLFPSSPYTPSSAVCINSTNNLCGWVLGDSNSWEEPPSSFLVRLPTARELLATCRESINEVQQILLQISRDGSEHTSLKQWPKSPKSLSMEARGQGKGCWAQLICAISLQLIAKSIRYLSHLFPSMKTCQDALSQNTH